MSKARKGGPGGTTRGRSSGRVTSAPRAPVASARYTPPTPKSQKKSPVWMGILILALLVGGALVIILNYVDVMPASPTSWYILAGIGLIAAGFIVATRYH
jgi:Cell division protein CrgA